MTEEIKNGVEAGNENQIDGVKGGDEKVVDGGATNIEKIMSRLEELEKSNKSKDKVINELTEKDKKRAEDAEQARLASLSTEQRLAEYEAKDKARAEKDALIKAATSNGLNLQQANELVEKVKAGDFDGFAIEMAKMINEVKTTTSQQVETEVKSKIQTSTAPATKDNTTSPFMASMRKAAGL